MCSTHTVSLFFFNDTATTEIYTLSLHDALPIYNAKMAFSWISGSVFGSRRIESRAATVSSPGTCEDRKSTRLNSSHSQISYAVFCLKKKNSMSTQLLGRLTCHDRSTSVSE